MAAQGQTIFAASGDNGAYDNGSSLSVDDPAAQPFVTGVGGTTLTTQRRRRDMVSRRPPGTAGPSRRARRAAISSIWHITGTSASYQQGVIPSGSASLGSQTMRNVPDVSLDADPNTGYAIYQAAEAAGRCTAGRATATPLWSGSRPW